MANFIRRDYDEKTTVYDDSSPYTLNYDDEEPLGFVSSYSVWRPTVEKEEGGTPPTVVSQRKVAPQWAKKEGGK